MSVTEKFLREGLYTYIKSNDPEGLCSWLQVEPRGQPDEYGLLSQELKNGVDIVRVVDEYLPEEDDLPDGQWTAWAGFKAFVKEYLEYWRDVDFQDCMVTHQLLAALTKQPDLSHRLRRMDTGDEDEKSIVESTAELITKVFTVCLTDRSMGPKKLGVYKFANMTLKLLFACGKTHLAKQLFTNMTAKSPPLSCYPASQRVTYLYYLGRFHFINGHFGRAAQCLEEAYLETASACMKHKEWILTYLIPSNLLLGNLPSHALLQRPEAQHMGPIFHQLAVAVRSGNFLLFQTTLQAHETLLLHKGLLLTLTYRLRPLLWRALSRRTFLLTYIAPMDADSRKAATLELDHLVTASEYVQRRLEGWLPAMPPRKRQNPNVAMLLMAVANSSARGHHDSTLAPPPGGPRTLKPAQGLIWGNMAISTEHVEGIVASLIAQGLLHGYLAHSQGRFAIMGAKQKGSAASAGWPPVAEVLNRPEDEVPGWIKG